MLTRQCIRLRTYVFWHMHKHKHTQAHAHTSFYLLSVCFQVAENNDQKLPTWGIVTIATVVPLIAAIARKGPNKCVIKRAEHECVGV